MTTVVQNSDFSGIYRDVEIIFVEWEAIANFCTTDRKTGTQPWFFDVMHFDQFPPVIFEREPGNLWQQILV